MTRKDLLNQAKSLNLIRLSKLKKSELQALIEARFKGEVPLRHLSPKLIFKGMLSVPSWEWQIEKLEALSGKFLVALCIIMGCPKSGTKKAKIERLLQVAGVRKALSEYARPKSHEELIEICDALASKYSGKELKALCRQAKCFPPSTKYGMAASLFGWRESAISRGEKAFKDSLNQIQSKRTQLAA